MSYSDIDRDPNKAFEIRQITYDEGVIGRPFLDGWRNSGLPGPTGLDLSPIIPTGPGEGMLMFAHTYDQVPVSGGLGISYIGGFPNLPANVGTSIAIEVREVTRLSAALADTDQQIDPDTPFVLAIDIRNDRPSTWDGLPASDVEAIVRLPDGLSLNPDDGRCQPPSSLAEIRCSLGTLGAGGSTRLLFNAQYNLASARSAPVLSIPVLLSDSGPKIGTSQREANLLVPVADADDDGVIDADDAFPTDPSYVADSDGDGLPDTWELDLGLNPDDGSDANQDPDADGFNNTEEFRLGNAPLLADADTLLRKASLYALGQQDQDEFGFAVASGDLNADGYDDLVIGAPAPGRLFIAYGDDGGTGTLTEVPKTPTVSADANRFGRALAVADFDGNGADDIAVGADGVVWVYHNGAAGIDADPLRIRRIEGVSSSFGARLASGDLDGDGLPDLAVGEPDYGDSFAAGRGAVFFYLSSDGRTLTEQSGFSFWLGGSEGEDRLGNSLAIADLTGDGRVDLALGAPGNSRAYLWRGANRTWASGLPSSEPFDARLDRPGGRFGAAMASGDIDGDGVADLVIGDPDGRNAADSPNGFAEVYLSRSGYAASSAPTTTVRVFGELDVSRTGASLAVVPVDGDAYADLVVGAPDFAALQGSALVFRGGPEGVTFVTTLRDLDRDQFGGALAAGDFNGDGRGDVAVGASAVDRLGFVDGYVRVLLAGGEPSEDDADADRVADRLDNCAAAANPSQEDLDRDALGDACDADIDGDGLSNEFEGSAGLDARSNRDATTDRDGDGVSNLAEAQSGTDPNDAGSSPLFEVPATDLFAAVLPRHRSTQIGNRVTAFATLLNAGAEPALGCAFAPLTPLDGTFGFAATDAVTNAPIAADNLPQDLAAGAAQSFVFEITPAAETRGDIELRFDCRNTAAVARLPALNAFGLTATAAPSIDMIALAATPSADGVLRIADASSGNGGSAAFALASINVGVADSVTARVRTLPADLPVSVTLCETDPSDGRCRFGQVPRESLLLDVAALDTPTFSVFAGAASAVPLDAAAHRVVVEFLNSDGTVVGSSSVAVTAF